MYRGERVLRRLARLGIRVQFHHPIHGFPYFRSGRPIAAESLNGPDSHEVQKRILTGAQLKVEQLDARLSLIASTLSRVAMRTETQLQPQGSS